MGTPAQTGAVTITPIYWTPEGYNFNSDPTYQPIVNTYINDIAADSGTNSNVYAINSEWYSYREP